MNSTRERQLTASVCAPSQPLAPYWQLPARELAVHKDVPTAVETQRRLSDVHLKAIGRSSTVLNRDRLNALYRVTLPVLAPDAPVYTGTALLAGSRPSLCST
jgi:hypothetical protein